MCSGYWDDVWSEGLGLAANVEKVEKIFKDFIEEIYEKCPKGANEWRVTIKNNVEAVINAHIDDDFQLLFSNISTQFWFKVIFQKL